MSLKRNAILSATLFLFSALPAFSAEIEISRSQSGTIKVHPLKNDATTENSLNHVSMFPVFSQIGMGVSVFTTSVLFATGYSEERLVTDFGNQFNLENSQGPRQGIYAAEVLLLLGALTASLFNYNLGFDNDILAIIPIMPIQVAAGGNNSFQTGNDRQYRVQYGIYFYFSRDF